MPFDTIKTRMQSLAAKQQYRNSFHAGYRILTEEGVLSFWRGTTPRLGRLIVSHSPTSVSHSTEPCFDSFLEVLSLR